MKRLLLFITLCITAYAQKDPKTYYEQLSATKPKTAEALTFMSLEATAMAEQLRTKLTAAEVKALLPAIFAAVKRDDPENTNNAVLGLYAVSSRPDAAQLLKPHLGEIKEMFNGLNSGRKATAGSLLMSMQTMPEAPEILLEFIYRPLDPANPHSINEKIDALTALTRMQRPPMEKMEAAAVYVLKQPMPDRTTAAAINAAMRYGASNLLVDAIGEKLNHSDADVRRQTVFALRFFGPGAVERHRGMINKLANDPKEREQVRRIAQGALDGKELKCLTPTGDDIPGCK